MNIKKIALISLAIFMLFIAIAASYFIVRPASQIQSASNTETNGQAKQTTGDLAHGTPNSTLAEIINPPDGWKVFEDANLKIAFAYPETWQLSEDERGIVLTGDGYSIRITNIGGELGRKEWTHPRYYIGGYEVPEVFEFFDGKKYEQILSMNVNTYSPYTVIKVLTPGNSKEISDRIISSVIFLK